MGIRMQVAQLERPTVAAALADGSWCQCQTANLNGSERATETEPEMHTPEIHGLDGP